MRELPSDGFYFLHNIGEDKTSFEDKQGGQVKDWQRSVNV